MQLAHHSTKASQWLTQSIGLVLLVWLLTFLPQSAHAEWSKKDQQRQLTYTALHLMDWGQTLDISSHPEDYQEENPILGSHPTRAEVNTFMAATLAGHWLVARKLEPEKRRTFQWVSIAVRGLFIVNNKRIGLSINF